MNKISKILSVFLFISILFTFTACRQYTPSPYNDHNANYHSKDVDENGDYVNPVQRRDTTQSDIYGTEYHDEMDLKVTFVDVGNADCSLIRLPNGEVMLIDGGNVQDGEDICALLKNYGITKIDYLVGTHPHEDHVGGFIYIINHMNIGQIYMPKIPDEYVPSTKMYNDLLTAISNKGYSIISPHTGDIIYSDEDKGLEVKFLNSSDGITSDDLNAYSLVLKIKYWTVSYIFTGDALIENEQKIMQDFDATELRCQILKIAHHGSTSSNSEEWLDILNPAIVYIPCGANNEYGHPHDKILDILNSRFITIYRADTNGSVEIATNGYSWTIKEKLTGDIPLGEEGWSASLIQ